MALLSIKGVTVKFSGLTALSDVSFDIEPGRVHAVIGPNGAGKSTLFNVITGYISMTEGEVWFEGQKLNGLRPHTIACRGMRRTFQNGGIFAEMTVLENVLTGLAQVTASSIAGLAVGMPAAYRAEMAAMRRACDLMRLMGISELADRPAKDLSSGQQRLVEITRALATEARLLLLDEPAVGLSVQDRENLMAVLRKLTARGVALLLVEHSIDLVMAISDRIVVLNHGQVIADGEPAEIRTHDAVLEAYLGRN
jgi:branched-chain amino acid transport system ATP-binding protein